MRSENIPVGISKTKIATDNNACNKKNCDKVTPLLVRNNRETGAKNTSPLQKQRILYGIVRFILNLTFRNVIYAYQKHLRLQAFHENLSEIHTVNVLRA